MLQEGCTAVAVVVDTSTQDPVDLETMGLLLVALCFAPLPA